MCWPDEEDGREARERRGISTWRVEEDVGGMVTTVGLADSRVLQSLTGPGLLQAHGCRRLMWEERVKMNFASGGRARDLSVWWAG